MNAKIFYQMQSIAMKFIIRNTSFLLLLLFCACTSLRTENDRPNIILIIVDDLGIGSLTSFNPGSKIKTPNIDKLAVNGLQLEQFYVTSPVCSPSRASLLTGLTPYETKINKTLKPSRIHDQTGLSDPTIATALDQAGYRTGFVGKWHLGYKAEEHPLSCGYSTFAGFLSGHIDYISHVAPSGKFNLERNRKKWKASDKHLTKVLTKEALAFVGKESEKPYFLTLSYANPHTPILLPGDKALFPGKKNSAVNTPLRYDRLVELLDAQLGRLIDFVEQQDDNTMIVFISDNGGLESLNANTPYRGGKGNLFEGGIKVPAMIYWPGKLTPSEFGAFTTALDIYPTLMDAAGVKQYRAGGSLLDTNEYVEQPFFMWNFMGADAVRMHNLKGIFLRKDHSNPKSHEMYANASSNSPAESWSGPDGVEYWAWLYDLESDPMEQKNIAETNLYKLQELWLEKSRRSEFRIE